VNASPGRQRPAITLPEYRRGMKPANAGRTFPAEVLTRDEVHAILRACGRGYAGTRNRAMFVVMWRCGLRIAEVLALYPSDVDLEAGTVTVRHGKGNRRRTVGIDPEAGAVIAQWLDRRRQLGVNGRHPLFCVIQRPGVGKPMWASCAREALQETAVRAGIERRVHPHGLRHTHAVELLRERVSLLVIQKQLGHNQLSTTARYLDHLMPLEVVETMQARTWSRTGRPPESPPGA
jgi:integrase/recombinase XerD